MQEKNERWDPSRYTHPCDEESKKRRNRLQQENAEAMLDKCQLSIEEGDLIIDFGSGAGNITAYIAENYPQALVVGVDSSEAMVEYAQNSFSKDTFPNLNFVHEDCQTYTPDKPAKVVTGFNFYHWLDDLDDFIKERVPLILDEDGYFCFMLYPRVEPLWNAIDETAMMEKWGEYFPEYQSPYFNYDENSLRPMLDDAGFSHIEIDVTPKIAQYDNGKEGLKEYIWGFLPLLGQLPTKELQSEFLDDVMEKYVQYQPLESNGSCILPYDQIDIRATGLQPRYTAVPTL